MAGLCIIQAKRWSKAMLIEPAPCLVRQCAGVEGHHGDPRGDRKLRWPSCYYAKDVGRIQLIDGRDIKALLKTTRTPTS